MGRPASPPGIFISYRRDDSSGFAGRLYDRLVQRFGADRVFMDIDTIRPGHEFAADIERALSECGACIVLIGRSWESITLPDGRRRLDEPTDFVRLEVAAAIRRGVAVFPVLVEGAKPPSAASLPEEIRDVSGRQAIELSNERWNYDVGRLLLALDEAVGEHKRRRLPRIPLSRPAALIAGAAILLSLAGTIGWITTRGPNSAVGASSTGGPSASDGGSQTGGPSASPQPGDCRPPVLPSSSGGVLSGTYAVTLSLECRQGEPGRNRLWGEPVPMRGVIPKNWRAQPWTFADQGSGPRWRFEPRGVSTPLILQGDGTYTARARGTVPQSCLVPSRKKTTRTLFLSVSGEPDATAINGWLVISWTCRGPFVARLKVAGVKSG